ncbi:unnamed protein product [Closterium sp. Naga37s-1]|nr:unnamed protein product [Closterium sp. Naga37s-1]
MLCRVGPCGPLPSNPPSLYPSMFPQTTRCCATWVGLCISLRNLQSVQGVVHSPLLFIPPFDSYLAISPVPHQVFCNVGGSMHLAAGPAVLQNVGLHISLHDLQLVLRNVGLCISLHDLQSVQGGFIYPPWTRTSFSCHFPCSASGAAKRGSLHLAARPAVLQNVGLHISLHDLQLVLRNVGLCISLHDLQSVEGGFIFPSDPGPHFTALSSTPLSHSLSPLTYSPVPA